MLLLGLIVGATALGNWRLSRTWTLLGASVVLFWIADSLYLITVATNTYEQNAWFNPLWYWSPVLAAWAAWLPRRACAHAGERSADDSWDRDAAPVHARSACDPGLVRL